MSAFLVDINICCVVPLQLLKYSETVTQGKGHVLNMDNFIDTTNIEGRFEYSEWVRAYGKYLDEQLEVSRACISVVAAPNPCLLLHPSMCLTDELTGYTPCTSPATMCMRFFARFAGCSVLPHLSSFVAPAMQGICRMGFQSFHWWGCALMAAYRVSIWRWFWLHLSS